MHFSGIRINDPDNGVWLPRTKADKGHWAMPHAPAHSEIHTHNYEAWVFRMTQNIRNGEEFRGKLTTLRALLKDGRQDSSVTQPPIKR